MNAPRNLHTATLLPNGKVLVAGGRDDVASSVLDSAELYDPATGTWSITGRLIAARLGHTATLLPNGKVLVAGGQNNEALSIMDSAELYDPDAGTWSSAGRLRTPRVDHTATLLASGKVLVVGGLGRNSAELFDPTTGTWSQTGSLTFGRESHQATVLRDGRVLVTGGTYDSDLIFPEAAAEIFDPPAGTWKVTSNLNVPRSGHSATPLPDGTVLVAGGLGPPEQIIQGDTTTFYEASTNTAELFAPATTQWTLTGNLNAERTGHTASLLSDGTVLIAGGSSATPPNYVILGTAELYDPSLAKWELTFPLNSARTLHTATSLADGRVLIVGGVSASGSVLSTAEIYGTVPANSFRMTAMFTDQAGLFQYIQLQELSGLNDQHHFAGLTLSVRSRSGVIKTVTFTKDLPESNTAGRYVLLGTTLALEPPVDFALPPGFIPTDGGTLTFAGVDVWDYPVLPADGHAVLLRDNTFASNPPLVVAMIFRLFGGYFTGLGVPIDPVIEYYNASLDHYFITASQPDIDALDSNRTPGWSRTGESFPAYISNLRQWFDKPPDLRPVCRFWIPPAVGDSHFFSASSVECAVAQAIPNYVQETDHAFFASLPNEQTGECLNDQMPVYRLWNGRFDSNHRYTSSAAIRDLMRDKGYIAEGYGPNAVAMCVGGGIPQE